jgi:hypothetical protein
MDSTTRISRPAPFSAGPHARIRALLLAALLVTMMGATGCLEFLVAAGLFPRPKVEAAFKFGEGAVAVLVDDYQEVFYWPDTKNTLSESIVEELINRGAVETVIPSAAVNRLRQTDPKFDERACTEIGRMLNADQVLLVEARSFYAIEDPAEQEAEARMSVSIKVINALETQDRRKVRLWPRAREGYILEAELIRGELIEAKTRSRILRRLTDRLAEKIVRKFYDRRMDTFEKEE